MWERLPAAIGAGCPSHNMQRRRILIKKFDKLAVFAALLLSIFAAADAFAQQLPDPELREVLKQAANASYSFEDRFAAEVWLTDMSRRLARQVWNPQERIRILTRVHHEATRAELPPELVLAVIEVESNFDQYAISVAGALGMMQVMPFWIMLAARA